MIERALTRFCLLFILLAPVVHAQPAPVDVEEVIAAQVEAFEAGDLARAFSFASPMIQGMFGSPERFGQMVERGYPMVWRPAALAFSCQRDVAGAVIQSLEITDQAGGVHFLDYEMIRLDGAWRINGVYFRPPSCLGA